MITHMKGTFNISRLICMFPSNYLQILICLYLPLYCEMEVNSLAKLSISVKKKKSSPLPRVTHYVIHATACSKPGTAGMTIADLFTFLHKSHLKENNFIILFSRNYFPLYYIPERFCTEQALHLMSF